MTQKARLALTHGGWLMTWSTNRSKGAKPVVEVALVEAAMSLGAMHIGVVVLFVHVWAPRGPCGFCKLYSVTSQIVKRHGHTVIRSTFIGTETRRRV